MKRFLSFLLVAVLTFSMLSACGTSEVAPETAPAPTVVDASEPAATVAPTEPEETKSPIAPLQVVRNLPEIQGQDGIEPYANFYGGTTHVNADLSENPALAYSLTISDKTTFETMPAGYDPEALLEWGKYPGLNVDILHKYGFTGEGAVIAYVDQPISGHPQYNVEKLHYTNNSDGRTSMHGSAVLSLLAGKDIGTAPEAEVYFYAHAAWLTDQTTHAECLYQIIEQNKLLPEDQRITMVGFSDNPDPKEKNKQAFLDAQKACEEAGIMVWYCGEYGIATFLPMSDKNNPYNLDTTNLGSIPSLVFVPAAGRTTAAEITGNQYIYWSSGGLSWTMPYVLGLYGIVKEIDPSLTQDDLRKLIVETAYDNNGMKIVNPVGFVAKALQNVGRAEEAQAMLDEVAARNRYLYAVMDTAAMSEEDLTAVGNYLADITDATVLVADAASFSTAEELYTALQADATQRGGEVVGVQIFGTPAMVPAFEVQYKVRMYTGDVDDGGTFLSDLFYGNFNNDPARISDGYNVMDHFELGWDVDLVPQWPVARLPLSKGEFTPFFKKYDAFVKATGLQRQDLVNFSNPIFANSYHGDDMGTFLNRMRNEFDLLDIPYRLYGNLLGDYPVTNAVLGGFTADSLATENATGITEFLINSHGQSNNIDKCFYEGGVEKRESLVNMDTINSVLDDNFYYLDMWTCLNGFDMQNNLTTTALTGNCVGMFSATAVISNNGVDCDASVADMANSNFYYFYYHYLKALNENKSRADAFYTAQIEYANALIADSANGIRSQANYQFNLCNLLTYHNFGVIESNHTSSAFDAIGCIAQAGQSISKQQVQRRVTKNTFIQNTVLVTEGNPIGQAENVTYYTGKKPDVHSFTKQQLDNDHIRFTIEFTVEKGRGICIFTHPNGDIFKYHSGPTTGEKETLVFDIPKGKLEQVKNISTQCVTINFYFDDNDHIFVNFKP